MEDALLNLPNYVSLSDPAYVVGLLSIIVASGACFAFILYFIMTSLQLAPRYKLVAILSAVVMASAGFNLFKEAQTWQATYAWSLELMQWIPMTEGQTFSNAYRYGNWMITVPLLLLQLPIALGLLRRDVHKRGTRMIVAGLAMIVTGLIGQFYETSDLALFNIWGVVSSLFFFWLLFEVYGVIKAGKLTTPAELSAWPMNLLWYILPTWGLYALAYAVVQLGQTETVVVAQQIMFSVADITTKLVYGVILSRFCLRRSALEGYLPAIGALDETGATSAMKAEVK
ncbi:MAG: bacteriorhodopsin [Litorimonas sp.]